MRIATWNVNSIRARLERVVAWLAAQDVDVLAIQETKCTDAQFPVLACEAAGYQVAHAGINQWNGVAILSRIGLDDVTTGFANQPSFGRDEPVREPRAISARCGPVRIWSMYVPNGRTLSDPHYEYKLEWLGSLADAASTWVHEPTLLLGDWNVAERDEDVWDIAAFEGSTHVSSGERAALRRIEAAGYTEVSRPYTPGQYTYWDYQQLAFPKNQGMRIDLAFANHAAAPRVEDVWIDRDERKGKGASDHVPVIVELR